MITDIRTTYFDRKGNPTHTVVESYIPKEHTLKVSRIETGKTHDRQGLRFESKERVNLY
jgi:hypothetical protein